MADPTPETHPALAAAIRAVALAEIAADTLVDMDDAGDLDPTYLAQDEAEAAAQAAQEAAEAIFVALGGDANHQGWSTDLEAWIEQAKADAGR